MGSLGESICAKLNTAEAGGYPKLWIKSTETTTNAYGAIAGAGGETKVMKDIVSTYASTNTSTILDLNSAMNRSDPVEMFMRGQSSVSTAAAPLTLKTGLLQTGTTTKYFTDYLYGSDTLPDPVANKTNLDTITKTTSGKTIDVLMNEFIRDSLILKSDEIYNAPDSTGKAPRTSLIRLYQGGTKLTTAEETLKTTLEQRNLKFFSAFLMEYCFYRTRYFYMLKQYFTAFQDSNPGTKYDTLVNELSGPTMPATTTDGVTTTPTNQNNYMFRLAHHMARCNMIMADMRKLLAQIRTYYDTIFQNVQTNIQGDKTITGSDANVRSAVNALQTSAEELKTYIHETEFRKAAMEYNQEKNRYGSMLLAFYAVLNLSALAMIYKLR